MAYEKQTWANGDTITAPKLNNIEGGVEGMNSSYEKQTWVTGEVITADKLNHIEEGIANGGSGGGSGDISTAQVTFVNNSGIAADAHVACAEDQESESVSKFAVFTGTTSCVVFMYKGTANCQLYEFEDKTITCNGDCEYDADEMNAYITGDCTITIS